MESGEGRSARVETGGDQSSDPGPISGPTTKQPSLPGRKVFVGTETTSLLSSSASRWHRSRRQSSVRYPGRLACPATLFPARRATRTERTRRLGVAAAEPLS